MDSRYPAIPRRQFISAAVAIGGVSALSACVDRENTDANEDPQFPRGPSDPSQLPERQHGWSQYLARDGHDNVVQPQHQLILGLDYVGDVPPTAGQREQVESAFQTIERAYRRGTGGERSVVINTGLVFMFGYAPTYFDRFEADLPSSVDLPHPETVIEELGEGEEAGTDGYDAVFVLMSDSGSILLSTEEALFGDLEELNGLPVEASLDGIFETNTRRTGFQGSGLPAERFENDDISEHAPLSMGFKSNFKDTLPSEDKVTIQRGPFEGGTTLQVSRLTIHLDRWYEEKDREARTKEMFCPVHTTDQVGETGEPLGSDSGITRDKVDNIDEYAAKFGRVGHAQKTAQARDDDFDPLILRRSEGMATDSDEPGFNFTSIQQGIADFIETRKQMNSSHLDEEIDPENHGILDYFSVESRATFLVPPRAQRALPAPRGGSG